MGFKKFETVWFKASGLRATSILQALGPHGQRARCLPPAPRAQGGQRVCGVLGCLPLRANAKGWGLVPGLTFHMWALLPPHSPRALLCVFSVCHICMPLWLTWSSVSQLCAGPSGLCVSLFVAWMVPRTQPATS